ncbi:hypothetical protein N7466_009176 [Penicillium verhagenii]|uniref:uncharacterized protein n=1 Tax=Penicillium verhagenii TaxID=1562060 RepID=UPI00254595ED|nr:uncharacterized protein N7466_009176 [Penicillium verhagenii]KAJ5920850.1 hypothetical protein N7466_009176 [Penicillium verhagenii]
MPDKRKASTAPPSSKKARISYEDESGDRSSGMSYEKPYNHPLYGQKNAFPGLDDAGDELCYDDADDGLEYLRMVRSEASALPSLFIAQTSKSKVVDTDSSQVLNTPDTKKPSNSFPRGFFDREEAYIAPVETKARPASPPNPYSEAQTSYYDLLRHRFLLLRSTLKCSPPASAIAGLDDAHPISLPRKVDAARKEWRRLVMAVNPQMVQLACMDQESVLGVLQIMARLMSDILRSGEAEKIRSLGAWAWGLLGRCREIGELSTEEVGDIRDIGKRAVKILQKVREAEDSSRTEDETLDSDTGEDTQTDIPAQEGDGDEADDKAQPGPVDGNDADMSDAMDGASELEAAKSRLQAKMLNIADDEPNSADQDVCVAKQTRAMLDMIITVVGEFFGQRDLLNSREVWAPSV